jgi:hypothetical protein
MTFGWMGAGRKVYLWSCSIEKCSTFLQEKSSSASGVARELLEKIILPIQDGCPVLRKQFVKETTATQIVAVLSFVKPWDRPKFMTHLCLSQCRYTTELDAFASGSMKQAFYKTGLISSPNNFTPDDICNILTTYVLTDLAFHPISARQFGKYIMAAKDTLTDSDD